MELGGGLVLGLGNAALDGVRYPHLWSQNLLAPEHLAHGFGRDLNEIGLTNQGLVVLDEHGDDVVTPNLGEAGRDGVGLDEGPRRGFARGLEIKRGRLSRVGLAGNQHRKGGGTKPHRGVFHGFLIVVEVMRIEQVEE